MELAERAERYRTTFPDYPPIIHDKGWLYGVWMIGANYKRTNNRYGAYPPSYLRRVHSMFPDAGKVLHLFSGGLKLQDAINAAFSDRDFIAHQGHAMELVDCHGPDEGCYPTWQSNVLELPFEWEQRFDLVLADPPYSKEDAAKYGDKTVPSSQVFSQAWHVARPGAFMVWLDQKLPMYQKKLWRLCGTIGLVRSTNHRMRLVSIFERQLS